MSVSSRKAWTERRSEARRLARLQRQMAADDRQFTNDQLPSPELSVKEILDHKRRVLKRIRHYENARHLVHTKIHSSGPFGLWIFGDLHLDDDGCAIDQLQEDMDLVLSTPAMFAGHIGDVLNSWIGKLAHLNAKQTTTAKQAWLLAEWFFEAMKSRMIFVTTGNHDAWNQGEDLLGWIGKQTRTTMEPRDIRLSLDCPNGRSIVVSAKHTHKGSSMWNQAHGQMRFAQKGIRGCHLVVSGHRHTSGYGLVVDPLDGLISHCIQIASYKAFDEYQRTGDFQSHFISPSVVAIINPDATTQAGLVQVFHDTKEGARYLAHLRQQVAR